MYDRNQIWVITKEFLINEYTNTSVIDAVVNIFSEKTRGNFKIISCFRHTENDKNT